MKKIFVLVLVLAFCLFQSSFSMDWKKDFGAPLLKEGQGDFKGEKLVDFVMIKDDVSFTQNIRNLFYPNNTAEGWGILWKTIRTIMVGVLIFFMIWAWFRFIMDADNETEVKKSQMNLVYIVFWAAVIFVVTRLLWDALNLWSVEWVVNQNGAISAWVSLLDRAENNIFVVVLWFLKGFAFFLAIIMMVYYGYQMMIAFDKEDKIKAAKTGILNVVIALIFIKLIDFLYYIAQKKDFATQANNLILVVTKFLWYIFGILIVLVIIYIAFQFITGGEEWFKKWVTFLKNILIIGLVIFLFLLVIYQIFHDVV